MSEQGWVAVAGGPFLCRGYTFSLYSLRMMPFAMLYTCPLLVGLTCSMYLSLGRESAS